MLGFESKAALTTVVGVLMEVPVLPLAVEVVDRTRAWYVLREGVPRYEACCPVGLHRHGEARSR